MSDERNQPGAPAFRAVGVGHQTTRLCMGCNKPRNTIGSAGSGVRWRCVGCIVKKGGIPPQQPAAR